MEIFALLFMVFLANIIARLSPMLFFKNNRLPAWVIFIENNFPPMIMVILIFYTIRDIDFMQMPHGIQELFAISVTIISHLFFKNFLLSVFVGTTTYMLTVNL
jgi:branched-subunit amino acid transport protein AzlD